MPKGRYRIMRAYMPKRGTLGLDMMLRTCTIQTNLDFASEADMVQKFRVGLAWQPVATALFANSPFTEGAPNGFLSYRSHVWTDTDPDRCGILPFVFEDGMGFERYVDYVLDVPMYFVYRDGEYIDAAGQSFRDFLAGRLPALPGEVPTISDWSDHLTTLFPEVRLKRFLEMRGADGGPWRSLCALPALWVGLLYHQATLDAAWDRVKDWTIEEHEYLRAEVPRARPAHAVSRRHRAGSRQGDAGARGRRPHRARRGGLVRPGRAPVPDRAARHRRERPHPGGGEARAVPRPLARQRRSAVRRIRRTMPGEPDRPRVGRQVSSIRSKTSAFGRLPHSGNGSRAAWSTRAATCDRGDRGAARPGRLKVASIALG